MYTVKEYEESLKFEVSLKGRPIPEIWEFVIQNTKIREDMVKALPFSLIYRIEWRLLNNGKRYR